MDNLKNALKLFISTDDSVSDIAGVLSLFSKYHRVGYAALAAIVSGDLNDTLLSLWEWKLVMPVSSSHCSEWDYRVLQATPTEIYEMPNISKVLMEKATATGRWDSTAAIRELFQNMGEPEWEKMPELVLNIKQDTRHNTINGARIGTACKRCGLGGKTGAMIAILKGAGIISPKLAALNASPKSKSPLYEFNPCVYAEKANRKFTKLDPIQSKDGKLAKALSLIFSERDAFLLAGVLNGNIDTNRLPISATDLARHDIKEILLLAFDERILIPIDPRSGPAWEDKILDFNHEGRFFIPPAVKAVLDTICVTGHTR